MSNRRRFRQRIYRILSVLIIIACVWLVILLEEARAAAVAGPVTDGGISGTDVIPGADGVLQAVNGPAEDGTSDTMEGMPENGGTADGDGANNDSGAGNMSGEEPDNEYAEALLECLKERVSDETGEYPALGGSFHIIISRDMFGDSAPKGTEAMYKKAFYLSADEVEESAARTENFIIINSDEYKNSETSADGDSADGDSAANTEGGDSAGAANTAAGDKVVLSAELVREDDTRQLWIYLDDYYEAEFFVSEKYVYIDLVRPRDVYDRIVVVDAGHGGPDPGAVTGGDENYEKLINLNIVLYLKELLDKDDSVAAYYTRVTDIKPSLEERVNMANGLDADLFLSIHCNSSEQPEISGFEVLYNQRQDDSVFNSKAFAMLCEEELAARFTHGNRGLIPMAGDVLIVGHSKVPVALMEIGYLSNDEDLSMMLKDESQRKFAEAAYAAIKRAVEEIEKEE